MVTQVPVIGILMIVNGSLTTLMGLLLAAVGPIMFTAIKMDGQGGIPPGEENVLTAVSIGYTTLGLLVLTAGILNIIGGIRACNFRGRNFAIVALFFNLLPVFTCYCSMTSIGLMIWGLIVMFNPDTARAFELAEEGYTPDEIKQRAQRAAYRALPDRGDRDDDFDPPRPSRPPRPENPDSRLDERIK